MLLATAVMAGMLYIPLKLLDQLVFDTTRTVGLLFLTGTAGFIGLSSYLFLSWVLGVGEVQSLFVFIKKLRRRGAIILEPAREVVGSDVEKIS